MSVQLFANSYSVVLSIKGCLYGSVQRNRVKKVLDFQHWTQVPQSVCHIPFFVEETRTGEKYSCLTKINVFFVKLSTTFLNLLKFVLFKASVAVQGTRALFWDLTQHRFVIPYDVLEEPICSIFKRHVVPRSLNP
jgi:hypothetical protein